MSHFTRVQTIIREKEYLVEALKVLNYQHRVRDTEDLFVRGYQGNRERAEIVVDTGTSYDIGFQLRGEEFQMVADWGMMSPPQFQRERFNEDVTMEYNTCLLEARIEADWGMELQRSETLPNGERILIAVTR